MDVKHVLRKELRNQAKLHTLDDFMQEDKLSCDALLQSHAYKTADRVFAFMPLDSEVNIKAILEHCIADKHLALPVCNEDTSLSFYEVEQLDALSLGRHGILAPETTQVAVPTEKDILIVPALAYTRTGDRLGRGKGYYDRYLSTYPTILSIGMCRTYQLLQSIPTEAWDIRVSKVLCAGVFY